MCRLHCILAVLGLVLPVISQTWDGPRPYKSELAPDVIAGDEWDAPYPDFEGNARNYTNDDDPTESSNGERLRSRALDFYLRIMPLGASITQGVGSSDGTGYRKLLRQQLRFEGFKVNMVGSKQNGNMADSVSISFQQGLYYHTDTMKPQDNQGHPGWTVSQVHEEWVKDNVKGLKPNLVLINAGT
jgi:hypothetical protein